MTFLTTQKKIAREVWIQSHQEAEDLDTLIQNNTIATIKHLEDSGLLEEREIEECEACNNCEMMMTCELVAQNTVHNTLARKITSLLNDMKL